MGLESLLYIVIDFHSAETLSTNCGSDSLVYRGSLSRNYLYCPLVYAVRCYYLLEVQLAFTETNLEKESVWLVEL